MSKEYADKVTRWRADKLNEVIRLSAEIRMRFPEGTKIRALDWGCNDGHVQSVLECLDENLSTVGIDCNPPAVKEGYERGRDVRLVLPNDGLPFANQTFDLVICLATLAHMADVPKALAEMARVTKPGGWVYIETPHPMYDAIMAPVLWWRGYQGDPTIIRKVDPLELEHSKWFASEQHQPSGRKLPFLLRWMRVRSDYKIWMERL